MSACTDERRCIDKSLHEICLGLNICNIIKAANLFNNANYLQFLGTIEVTRYMALLFLSLSERNKIRHKLVVGLLI